MILMMLPFLHDERVTFNAIVMIRIRLLHHAHVISITGDSYRLRNHMQQEGITVHCTSSKLLHSYIDIYRW